MEQVVALIASAAERLGYEAARVWPSIVMVTFVRGAGFLALGTLGCLGAIVGIWLTWRIVLRRYDGALARADAARQAQATVGHSLFSYANDPSFDSYLFGGAIPTVLLGILGICCALSLPDNLAAVLYPEAITVIRLVQGSVR